MIQLRSILEVADNTGARKAAMISRMGQITDTAGVGDIITVHIKQSATEATVKKGEVAKAVVVRTKAAVRRPDGSYLRFDSNAIVLIDATRDGRPAGTITYLHPECVGDLPRGLGAHDFGLKDLFAAAALIGRLPGLHLYTISVETIRPMCTELSPPVAAAVPEVAFTARAHAARLAAPAGSAAA